MAGMLRSGRNGGFDGLTYGGCSCHNTKAEHRKAKKSVKVAEKKQVRQQIREETGR